MIHTNSRKAWMQLDSVTRSKNIMRVYYIKQRELTDREVAGALGFFDLNSVRPRITELIQAGKLIETGRVKDHVTGKTVRCVMAVKVHEKQMEMAL